MKLQSIRKALLLISMLLFPVTLYYFSPFLIIVGGFKGIITGSVLLFALQFLSALFLGRAFCGWICPAGAIQDSCAQANGKPYNGKKRNLVKYFIWAPWLVTIVLGFLSAGGVKEVNFLFMTDHGISAAGVPGYIVYFLVVGLIVTLSLILGKRSFCHSFCWMAPFMVIGSKIRSKLKLPSLHLDAHADKCVGCGTCSKHCPMSLPVKEMVQGDKLNHTECILCGECVDGCPKKAIGFAMLYKNK